MTKMKGKRMYNIKSIKRGTIFGRLTIIGKAKKKKGRSEYHYPCRCSCGVKKIISGCRLRTGMIKSCGCLQRERASQVNSSPLIKPGTKINYLTIIAKSSQHLDRKVSYVCKCICGNELIIIGTRLRNKRAKSCGCVGSPRSKPYQIEIMQYKRGAIDRGLSWKLNNKTAVKLMSGRCHYCGKEPYKRSKRKTKLYMKNGIDRIDNTKGYIKDNCVSCCFVCNRLKFNLSYNDFINAVMNIAKYMRSKHAKNKM